jgi:hypothetical protein
MPHMPPSNNAPVGLNPANGHTVVRDRPIRESGAAVFAAGQHRLHGRRNARAAAASSKRDLFAAPCNPL